MTEKNVTKEKNKTTISKGYAPNGVSLSDIHVEETPLFLEAFYFAQEHNLGVRVNLEKTLLSSTIQEIYRYNVAPHIRLVNDYASENYERSIVANLLTDNVIEHIMKPAFVDSQHELWQLKHLQNKVSGILALKRENELLESFKGNNHEHEALKKYGQVSAEAVVYNLCLNIVIMTQLNSQLDDDHVEVLSEYEKEGFIDARIHMYNAITRWQKQPEPKLEALYRNELRTLYKKLDLKAPEYKRFFESIGHGLEHVSLYDRSKDLAFNLYENSCQSKFNKAKVTKSKRVNLKRRPNVKR